MFSYGYRAQEEEQHKIVVEFVKATFEGKYDDFIEMFDRVRRKRHEVIYDEEGMISEFEANENLKIANEYIKIVEERIKKRVSR